MHFIFGRIPIYQHGNNRNNTRYWATENNHLFRGGAFQERFGINVWLGVIGTRIVGPIFFYGPLNGARYLHFLQNEIQNFIEVLPVQHEHVFYQQDGAPPHNARVVTDYLSETFNNRWIGTHGPIRWPARSPDLTPLDFFYWAHIKEKVYHTQPHNIGDLRNRITQVINSITPIQMENVLREFKERITSCREVNGVHFEHLNYG